jgi:hypothetical protein
MYTNRCEGGSGIAEEIYSGSQGRADVLDLREERGGISLGWEGLKCIYAAHPNSPPRGRYQFDFIYLSTFPLSHSPFQMKDFHVSPHVLRRPLCTPPPPNSNPLSLSQSRSAFTIRLINNHSYLLVDPFLTSSNPRIHIVYTAKLR